MCLTLSQDHYDAVLCHSTSMESIYDMLHCKYDIHQKEINFLDILDLKYEGSNMSPISFYHQYRGMVPINLSRKNDVIKYKSNFVLPSA